MTDLLTLVEPLKREVAVPGTYDSVFPDTSDDDLAATLADAFGQAQLDGFFGTLTLVVGEDSAGLPTYATSLPLSAAGSALLVIYAGLQIMRGQIRRLAKSSTYKAGPVEYSTTNMTTVIRDEMASLKSRLASIVLEGRRSGRAIYVSDSYATRLSHGVLQAYSLGSFYSYES